MICQGEDVTAKIREPEIGWLASAVSMKRPVRQAMVRLQRKIGAAGKVVAEGRDTGTVVFPRAKFKFFLDANLEERARRRHRELVGKGLCCGDEKGREGNQGEGRTGFIPGTGPAAAGCGCPAYRLHGNIRRRSRGKDYGRHRKGLGLHDFDGGREGEWIAAAIFTKKLYFYCGFFTLWYNQFRFSGIRRGGY